jgi:hypothetical protein
MFGKNKTPQQRIRQADRSTQKLRDKRSQLNPEYDDRKVMKINNQIHRNNVEIDIAKRELSQQKIEVKNTSRNFSFNKNDNGKSLHLHYHNHKNKKK